VGTCAICLHTKSNVLPVVTVMHTDANYRCLSGHHIVRFLYYQTPFNINSVFSKSVNPLHFRILYYRFCCYSHLIRSKYCHASVIDGRKSKSTKVEWFLATWYATFNKSVPFEPNILRCGQIHRLSDALCFSLLKQRETGLKMLLILITWLYVRTLPVLSSYT